jgi:predicted SAM-dependent methyltransferase/glycosyltransferase involved in cell wall biosynthesis
VEGEGIMLISIIIPHAGKDEPLRRCIESVEKSIMICDIETHVPKSPSIPFEIIVVIDKPEPRTIEYLDSFRFYIPRIFGTELTGTEVALNKGLAIARGNYLCYLMSDVEILVPGAFDAMADALESNPVFGWVALSSEYTGFLAGCSMFTREAFEKVGYWDEGYVSGGGFSDDDYLRRMWKAGYQPHIVAGPMVKHGAYNETSTYRMLGEKEKGERFAKNRERFKQIYGEDGTDWDALPKFTLPPEMHRIDWIKSKVSLNDRILEVGCAENPCWAGTPFNVVTLDKSVRPDEQCFPDVVADAASLPYPDNSFDVVNLGELLEHVEDPQKVLSEATRVAKKKVIVTVPNEYRWPPALEPFKNPGHLRYYTEESLTKELEQTGLPFKVVNLRYKYWRHFGAEISCDGGEPVQVKIEKLKINWGSFVDTFGNGWLNVDILNIAEHITAGHKFKQWDVRQDLSWLSDNSVDLHRASHLIEHLTLEEVKPFLRELHRTLRPGGLVRISTPDLDTIVKHYYSRDMDFFNAVDQPTEYILAPTAGEKFSRLLFSGDYQHRAVYNWDMLKDFLEQAGFNKIFRSMPDFSHSEEMQMETVDQHVEISLLVEAIK